MGPTLRGCAGSVVLPSGSAPPWLRREAIGGLCVDVLESTCAPSAASLGLPEGMCGCRGRDCGRPAGVFLVRAPRNKGWHQVPGAVRAVTVTRVSAPPDRPPNTELCVRPSRDSPTRQKPAHPEATVSSNPLKSRAFHCSGFYFSMRAAPEEPALGTVKASKYVWSGVSVQILESRQSYLTSHTRQAQGRRFPAPRHPLSQSHLFSLCHSPFPRPAHWKKQATKVWRGFPVALP